MVTVAAQDFEIQPEAVNDIEWRNGILRLRPQWPGNPTVRMPVLFDSDQIGSVLSVNNAGLPRQRNWPDERWAYGIDAQAGNLPGVPFYTWGFAMRSSNAGVLIDLDNMNPDEFSYRTIVQFPNAGAVGTNIIASHGVYATNGILRWMLNLNNYQINFIVYRQSGFMASVIANCPGLLNNTPYEIQWSYSKAAATARVQVRDLATDALMGDVEVTGLPADMCVVGDVLDNNGLILGGIMENQAARGMVPAFSLFGGIAAMFMGGEAMLPKDFTVSTAKPTAFAALTQGDYAGVGAIAKFDAGRPITYDLATLTPDTESLASFATVLGGDGWEVRWKGGHDLTKLGRRGGWSDWTVLNDLTGFESPGQYLWVGLRGNMADGLSSDLGVRHLTVDPIVSAGLVEPVDERISVEVEGVLNTIKEANGYFTTVEEVLRIRVPGEHEPSIYPCIAFQVIEGDVIDGIPIDRDTEFVTLLVEAWIKTATNMDRALNRLKGDISDALAYDPTRGGNAFTTKYRRWVKYNTTATAPLGALQMYFDIQLRHLRTDSTVVSCK